MVIYQFSNSIQIFFVFIFSLVTIISIVVALKCLPMFKLFKHQENPKKAKILLLFICIPIYILCICGLIFGVSNIYEYSSMIHNTNLNNCEITSGEVSDIVKKPQFSRGADLVSYHIEFTVNGSVYYIYEDIGVIAEKIEHWNEGQHITAYYYIKDGKNMVIRVEKGKTAKSSFLENTR